MLIFPAIDLRDGKCVRLRQGDYNRETVFGSDPVAVAQRWVDQGARYLHLVDLDGARQGSPANGAVVERIVRAAGVPCQLGGGLRTEAHLEDTFSRGVTRVILGTRALRDPDWVQAMCVRFPQRVVLGIDARQGKVATAGWLDVSEMSALDLAARCTDWPLAALVYTDISRDGMMEGPNFDAMVEMAQTVGTIPVIASGGVTTLDDVVRLAKLPVAGCIIGRALYEGTIQLKQAIQVSGG